MFMAESQVTFGPTLLPIYRIYNKNIVILCRKNMFFLKWRKTVKIFKSQANKGNYIVPGLLYLLPNLILVFLNSGEGIIKRKQTQNSYLILKEHTVNCWLKFRVKSLVQDWRWMEEGNFVGEGKRRTRMGIRYRKCQGWLRVGLLKW